MLNEIDFPIEGFYADTLLILEGIIILISLEVSFIFWFRTIRNKNQIKKLQEKAYIWLFLGFSFMWIFFIIADHFVENGSTRLVFLEFGYLALGSGGIIFIYGIEKYKTLLRKFLFSIIFIIYLIFFIIISIIQINFAQTFSFFFWPIFLLFFIFYSNELGSLFKKNPLLGDYKKSFIKLVSGFLLLILGFGLTTDFSINILGLEARLAGDILQLMAFIFLYLFFSSIPSFSEYDWQEKINNLFIIHKSGLLIYKKSFHIEEEESYDSVTSGTITMLKIMLETISDQETSTFIEKKGKSVIIQPGKYIYGALIADEKLSSLQILLRNFVSAIEYTYANILKNWEGDLKVFRPIDKIAEEFFF
ncbi:MAG: hypothetical protein ACFE9S_01255 [Candidatus Hermodarchaeota archaeon]